MKKKLTFQITLILTVALMLSLPMFAFADGFEAPDGKQLTTFKEYNVAPGITEQHITTISSSGGEQVKSYAATIDLNNSNTGIMASYKDYDKSGKWGMQTVRDQAAAAEKATGKNVVMAINGDYFNMSTGEPLGALVMDGVQVHGVGSDPYYFAIMKDGSADIRYASESLENVREAVGSPTLLIENGKINESLKGDTVRIPRCAIGIKKDGSVVIFEADGRQAPTSVGLSFYETAQMMEKLGCVDALYLDGGGSATFASQSEGTGELTVKNSPSDGIERKVSSALLIYSTAKADGVFDHAAITPLNEIYTPGSEVQFEAVGVDSAGGAADMPSDYTYELADPSMGTIDASGKFKASDKTGDVVVNLKSGGEVKGTTTIQVQKPDSITFDNDEMSLGFEEESTLGLYVTYKGAEINYSGNDFDWTISDVTDASGKASDLSMGTFNGNVFKSSDGNTLYGTVTCAYKGDSSVKGSTKLIVGLQPTVVMDFEKYTDDEGNETAAKDYWTFNRATFNADGGMLRVQDKDGNTVDSSKWTSASRLVYGHYCNNNDPNNSRGGNESAEVIDIASGEPVRFGNNALKLNYDFSNINGIEGACVGFSSPTQEIPGSPTAIGMWVYAPEDTPNLWLRLRLKDGSGTTITLNFTDQMTGAEVGKLGGIDWTGWKYVEASLEGKQGPFSLIGGETIRLMHTFSAYGGMGNYLADATPIAISQCKGSVYVDNLQFVYGANTSDTTNPKITSVLANNTEISDDLVVNSNKVTFQATAVDGDTKYDTGIDFDTVNVILDGKNITNSALESGELVVDESKDAIFLYDKYLTNGDHSIKFTIRDKFGNEISETRNFVVDGTVQDTPNAKVVFGTEKIYLGENAELDVNVDSVQSVKSVSATIKLGKDFKDYKVAYGENFEEADAPKYDSKNNTVTVYANKKAGSTAEGDATAATISVKIPEDIAKDTPFTYAVSSGELTSLKTDSSEVTTTFSAKTKSHKINARYIIEAETMIAGFNSTIKVLNEDGEPVKGVGIYVVGGELIDTTDYNGEITTSKYRDVKGTSIYAKNDKGVSFIETLQSYATGGNDDGTPAFVSINASDDSASTKNITWISKPGENKKKAVAQVATAADYKKDKEAAFKDYEGTSKVIKFSGSSIIEENRAAYTNQVKVTGLASDTEYVYRVGDGEIWSEVDTFKTYYYGQTTNFFILGDTQAESDSEVESLNTVLNLIDKSDKDYAFGVQAGDFVEKPTIYDDWSSKMKAFDKELFDSIDMIHAIGNHELYGGDDDADIAKNIFGLSDRYHYSAEYGNVYVAVFGYVDDEAKAKEYAEWLKKDAAKSDARWKIVVIHQPPYGTNAETSDCRYITKYLPGACDAAGIDFVFSGHDHAYARTYALTGGERTKDAAKETASSGTVYMICGSTGGKSYDVDKSRYDYVIAGNDLYEGMYVSVKATDSKFTVEAVDYDGKVFDTFTMTKPACAVHEYTVRDDGHLVCNECGYARLIEQYTGVVTDEAGKVRYLSNGEFAKDQWVVKDDKNYYIESDGYAATGTKVFKVGENNVKAEYTFNKKGEYVSGSFVEEKVTNKNTGATKTITRYYGPGGKFLVHWNEIDGNMYYFKKTSNSEATWDLGMMYTGDGKTEKFVNAVGSTSDRYYVFAKDGKLVLGAFETETSNDGTQKIRYYWGDTYVKGATKIQGFTYDFDDKDGYLVVKDLADLSVDKLGIQGYTGKSVKPDITVRDGDKVLIKGVNYTVKYSNNVKCGTATAVVKAMNNRGYTGSKTITYKIRPAKAVAKVKNTSYDKQKVTWNKITGATEYRVYRSTDGKNYKHIKTIKSSSSKRTYSYNRTNLKTGKTYYYKVRAIRKSGGTTYYGEYSTAVKAETALSKASITSVKNSSSKTAVVKWNEVSGANGYKVYRSTSKNGTYKVVKTVKSGKTISYSNKKLKKGTTYYYKVKAYRTVDGKRVYGASSTVKSVKIKK